MKKKLFIFCSWDGVYFREQAKLIENEFDIQLIVFNSLSFGALKGMKKLWEFKSSQSPEGLPIFTLNYINLWFLPYFLQDIYEGIIAKQLQKKMSITPEDQLFVNTVYGAGFWAYIFNQKFGNQYIIDEHQQFILYNKTRRSVKLVPKVIKNAKKILVVSYDKARQMLNLGLTFDFYHIGNYVNENVFYPNNNVTKNDTFTIVSVGAYSYLKDSPTLFKVLKQLDEVYHKKVQFTYIGYSAWGKDNQQTVLDVIKEYNFSENITFKLMPRATRTEIATELQKSHLFLLTSISEGMCVSLMEALASGLPVCTTQCGGVDELITQFNGQIFPIRDYQSIAKYIVEYMDGNRTFDPEKIAHHLIKSYGNQAFKQKMLNYITQ